MGFEPIRRILPQAVRGAGIDRQVDAVRILELAQKVVTAFWGEEKAQWLHFVSFADCVLKVSARAPAALQELRLWDVRIRNEMNRQIGSARVKSILAILGGSGEV